MLTLMQVSREADRLVLSYPLWIGLAFLLASGLLCACAIRARHHPRRRWATGAATLVAAWAGLYFATFNATISNDAGSVYAFMRYDYAVRWKDASDIYLEQRGGDWHIVVRDRQHRAYDFNVADLSIDDRDLVMGYMVDRMPASAFHAEPNLRRRHASEGARPVGLYSEEQI